MVKQQNINVMLMSLYCEYFFLLMLRTCVMYVMSVTHMHSQTFPLISFIVRVFWRTTVSYEILCQFSDKRTALELWTTKELRRDNG